MNTLILLAAIMAVKPQNVQVTRGFWHDRIETNRIVTLKTCFDRCNETCAAIANALWNERLFRATGEAKYADVLERTIYNGFASGISLSGDEFFYPNPLAAKKGVKRQKWFGCSCCPVNDVRFIPQIPGFAFATKGNTVYWNLFLNGTADIDGFKVAVETDYPWSGKITLKILALPQPTTNNQQPATLKIRIPGWACGRPVPSALYEQTEPSSFFDVLAEVNGLALNGCPGEDGYLAIGREWKVGDVVSLDLPMPVKRIRACDKVAADRGRLAVEKGPIVYCAEGVDNGGKAYDAVLPEDATFDETSVTIGGKKYPALKASNGLVLIPYALWDNREPGNEMQVWFKTAEARLVSLESLLDEMSQDRTRADGSFVSRLWSSYDRRSVRNDGEAEGWYANHDWSNWIRSEKIAGRTECVMVDAKGPGAVTRIWTANGENTVLRLYLDGASEPTWTGLATNLTFGLAKPIPFPLRNAISQNVDPRYRAYNLYLPIPYAKSIRITAELPKSDHRFWYNVETRTYDTAAEVESLSPAVLSRAQKAIALTAEKITRKSSGSGQAFRFDRDSLVAGAAAEIAIERENSAVCGIDFGLDRETMMSLRLRMAFDGEETVDCRAAQLLGERAFARLPMPFAKSCKVTLENLGANVIDLSKARVQVVKRAWSAEKDLHFGAYGFAQTNIPTRVGKAGYHELPWLKLEGEGFLVGHALLLNNYADYGKAAWWGEGDEKIYVDGEIFPSYFGTGTEDFFGYAWGPNKAYDAAPFLSMPVADGDLDAKGRHRAEMWRLRKLDVVPFKKSVKLDVELWHWQDTTMDYAPATFWYARPGARKKIQNAAPLPNVSSMWTVWNGRTVAWSQVRNEAFPLPFVEWVELMAATGGNSERDCLKDPADRKVLDDYDFAPLVEVCRGILAMGAKPYLKLGGVPSKFTEDANGGSYKTNIRPPADPLVHYRYMRTCAAALKTAFGREAVRSWRFAVLTEADNFAWFKTADGDPAHTREAFFSLYDYTVRAFEEVLGLGLVIGTHLLDPNDVKVQPFTAVDFARHCLCGTNAATGGIGAPLRLLTFSNYIEPGVNGARGPNKFGKIAKALTEVRALGYTNLVTGIDEGRIIWGAKGSVKRDLHARAVGQSYQAAYDVRLAKTAYDLGFDYAATWGWFSGPESWEGLPSHHYFTQREIAKFAGMNRLEIDRATDLGLDVVAAVSADGKKVRAMVGFLTDDLNATNRFEGAVRLHLPPSFVNRRVTCRTLTLDDRNNWFCDWQSDRKRLGIKDDDFIWSPDGFSPLAGRGLKNPEHRRLFAEELQPRYAEKAKSIRPFESTVEVSSAAVLELPLVFRGNSAVFVDLD